VGQMPPPPPRARNALATQYFLTKICHFEVVDLDMRIM
jgi:hypothetical protein